MIYIIDYFLVYYLVIFVVNVIQLYVMNLIEWNFLGYIGFIWGLILICVFIWGYFRFLEIKDCLFEEFDVMFVK